MAPVALEPSRFAGGIARGSIVPSNPLDALAAALDATGKLVETAATIAKDNELRDVEDLLANPLITESEIADIEEDLVFPLVKIKARNRRGELIVDTQKDAIAEAVSQAENTVEARRILRQFQADLLENEVDEGIQAGIREAFAGIAPGVLSQAANNRRFLLRRNEEEDIAASQAIALDEGGFAFASKVISQLSDETLVNQLDVPRFHKNTQTALANFWLSGDDDTGEGINHNTHDTLLAIDNLLDVLPESDKAGYIKLRQRIQTAVAVARRAQATSLGPINKVILAAVQREVIDHKRQFPHTVVPFDLSTRYLDAAQTVGAASLATAETFLYAAPDSGPVIGVAGTKEAANERRILFLTLSSEGDFDDEDELGDKIMSEFDELLRTMDPNLRSEPAELTRILSVLRKEAKARHTALVDSAFATDEKSRIEVAHQLEVAEQLRAAGDISGANFILRQTEEVRRDMALRARRELLKKAARDAGQNFSIDYVNTFE